MQHVMINAAVHARARPEGTAVCRLPANASATKKRVAAFLKQRLRIPDVALIILFNVRPWAWAALAAWLIGAPLASRMEVRDDLSSKER